MYKKTALFFLLFFVRFAADAQPVNEQLWFEYMQNYPFADKWNLENAVTYSTLLNKPRWHALDYSATVEWSLNKNIDLLAQTLFSYTWQNEATNTLEIRPAIGTRIYFTLDKRIQTRLLLRLEQRNFKDLETKAWEQVYRPRIRAEIVIPFNKYSLAKDDVWYGMMTAEWLHTNDELKERFANRQRFSIGAGYKLNYHIRFEFLYMLQKSRQLITDDFESSDNIFRFRVKQFLRKNKPSKLSGVGG